jgi:hypothetical protein
VTDTAEVPAPNCCAVFMPDRAIIVAWPYAAVREFVRARTGDGWAELPHVAFRGEEVDIDPILFRRRHVRRVAPAMFRNADEAMSVSAAIAAARDASPEMFAVTS